jgi:hypothetical protein
MEVTPRKLQEITKSVGVVENICTQAFSMKALLRKCTLRRTFNITKILYEVITEGTALTALPRPTAL